MSLANGAIICDGGDAGRVYPAPKESQGQERDDFGEMRQNNGLHRRFVPTSRIRPGTVPQRCVD